MSDFALPVVLGIALAAATGFRVFLPMLIVSAAAYTGHLPLDNSFAWLGTSCVYCRDDRVSGSHD
jgi:NaMN:DMB phosphoribosyltransferase